MTNTFDKSFLTAAARGAREDIDDAGTSLLNQVIALRTSAEPLWIEDYRADYEARQAEFYVQVMSGMDSLYQHLHATAASAARFVGSKASPPLDVRTLAQLEDALGKLPTHSLAGEARRIRREIGLLRWLSTVRNKAVQHRSEEGYLASRGMIIQNGVALLRNPTPPDPESVRKAKALLRGLIRKYDLQLDPGEGAHEAIAYLDFVSHVLYASEPAAFDSARRVVEAARRHDLLLSQDLLRNADDALAKLISLAPPNPSSPFNR